MRRLLVVLVALLVASTVVAQTLTSTQYASIDSPTSADFQSLAKPTLDDFKRLATPTADDFAKLAAAGKASSDAYDYFRQTNLGEFKNYLADKADFSRDSNAVKAAKNYLQKYLTGTPDDKDIAVAEKYCKAAAQLAACSFKGADSITLKDDATFSVGGVNGIVTIDLKQSGLKNAQVDITTGVATIVGATKEFKVNTPQGEFKIAPTSSTKLITVAGDSVDLSGGGSFQQKDQSGKYRGTYTSTSDNGYITTSFSNGKLNEIHGTWECSPEVLNLKQDSSAPSPYFIKSTQYGGSMILNWRDDGYPTIAVAESVMATLPAHSAEKRNSDLYGNFESAVIDKNGLGRAIITKVGSSVIESPGDHPGPAEAISSLCSGCRIATDSYTGVVTDDMLKTLRDSVPATSPLGPLLQQELTTAQQRKADAQKISQDTTDIDARIAELNTKIGALGSPADKQPTAAAIFGEVKDKKTDEYVYSVRTTGAVGTAVQTQDSETSTTNANARMMAGTAANAPDILITNSGDNIQLTPKNFDKAAIEAQLKVSGATSLDDPKAAFVAINAKGQQSVVNAQADPEGGAPHVRLVVADGQDKSQVLDTQNVQVNIEDTAYVKDVEAMMQAGGVTVTSVPMNRPRPTAAEMEAALTEQSLDAIPHGQLAGETPASTMPDQMGPPEPRKTVLVLPPSPGATLPQGFASPTTTGLQVATPTAVEQDPLTDNEDPFITSQRALAIAQIKQLAAGGLGTPAEVTPPAQTGLTVAPQPSYGFIPFDTTDKINALNDVLNTGPVNVEGPAQIKNGEPVRDQSGNIILAPFSPSEIPVEARNLRITGASYTAGENLAVTVQYDLHTTEVSKVRWNFVTGERETVTVPGDAMIHFTRVITVPSGPANQPGTAENLGQRLGVLIPKTADSATTTK